MPEVEHVGNTEGTVGQHDQNSTAEAGLDLRGDQRANAKHQQEEQERGGRGGDLCEKIHA